MWVVISKDELASQCAAGCSACPMELVASSTGGAPVAQYCRIGAAEDPWISAEDHPASIVYGENSYAGHNEDDALNFGGSNVWINRLPSAAPAAVSSAPPVDTVSGYAHMTFEGEDWYLVRRDHDPDGWHRANDQLAGTEEYGSLSTDSRAGSTFSVPFGAAFTKYLLASGDMSMWVVISKDELASQCAAGCSACPMELVASSTGGAPVAQYCRIGVEEDPWISAEDHPASIVYGENSYAGHNEDDALNFGGSNVWINALPPLCRGSALGIMDLEDMPVSLIGYWPLDGTPCDASLNEVHALATNGEYSTGLWGDAFYFDGDDVLVVIDDGSGAGPLDPELVLM
eukprot:SAG22_NODE_1260_length_4978_cov_36.695269_4_plen_343_part_01